MRWIAKSSSGEIDRSLQTTRSDSYIYPRLKKVQGKKKRDAEAAEKQQKAAAANSVDVQEITDVEVDAAGGGDLLSSKDEDVIF